MNQNKFIEEVKNLGIEVTDEKIVQLEKYYELLIEYNKVMNLTGIVDKEEVYLKHFYDSLTIAKIIDLNKENNLCDLGSGAGFPGIVLKIFYPELNIVLIDSLNKRIIFLNKIIEELDLKNIVAIHTRIEDYAKNNKEKFDIVTARAVAPLNILLELGINLVKVGKYFIAMKGNIQNEPNFKNAIETLNCNLDNTIEFKLPIENSNRSLIKIRKAKSTNKLFPRKYSDIKKKPL
jgi:16S rRNA (guanine527-N7)-methyltransferase